MRTPLSSVILVFWSSIIGSFGAVFLKLGSGRLRRGLRHIFMSWHLAAGVVAFLISSYFFVLGIRRGELTILYPLVSLNYIWTLIWSRLFFKEPFTANKFLGLGLILLGVFFIGLGNR